MGERLRTVVEPGELYPVAPGEPGDRTLDRVRATGEHRPVGAGEWYLSGAVVEGYRAIAGTHTPYPIGELVHGELVWRPVVPPPTRGTPDNPHRFQEVDRG